MANFAKAQLLKYGWTEGKGLGKNESGIPEAIRPKLKFDNAGIGHDSSEQFTYHWWENVFNEAAKNVTVKSDNEGVSMKVIDEDTVDITTKKSSIKALKRSHAIHYGSFLKTATLLNDGKIVNEDSGEPDSMDRLAQKIDHVQLSDEDLFKACGGRTAHKGARHGLNLGGKLARIAEQERQLLAKINSDKEKTNVSSSSTLLGKEYNYDFESISKKRSKSKRKMIKTDPESVTNVQEPASETFVNGTDPQPSCSYAIDPDAGENLDASKSKRRTKKSKKNNGEHVLSGNSSQKFKSKNDSDSVANHLHGLDVTRSIQSGLDDNANTIEQDDDFVIPPLMEELPRYEKTKKSRKRERRKMNELMAKLDASCVIDESTKIAKKRVREEGQQIVEDILMTALEDCGTSAKKCKKIKAEVVSDSSTYDADKLNAKILRRKKHSQKKKRRDKLNRIAQNSPGDSILVNIEDLARK